MLFRWHQARNSSSESRAIASFFLSVSQRRRVGTSRKITAIVVQSKYTRDWWKRQVSAPYLGSRTRLVRGTDARKKEHTLMGLGEIAQTVGQHSQHHPLHGSALPLLPLAAPWPDP